MMRKSDRLFFGLIMGGMASLLALAGLLTVLHQFIPAWGPAGPGGEPARWTLPPTPPRPTGPPISCTRWAKVALSPGAGATGADPLW